MEKKGISVKELDTEQPDCFYEAYELSRPVMIRTYAS